VYDLLYGRESVRTLSYLQRAQHAGGSARLGFPGRHVTSEAGTVMGSARGGSGYCLSLDVGVVGTGTTTAGDQRTQELLGGSLVRPSIDREEEDTRRQGALRQGPATSQDVVLRPIGSPTTRRAKNRG